MRSAYKSIPICLIFLILIAYTALGGVVICYWETDWTFFDSFYFSFITMTTVGFGDYVPKEQSFYIVTLIYIVLGLAITTMCVDIAGSAYIRKIHFMGRKVKKAHQALKTMGEVMQYAAFLRKTYDLTDEQLINFPLLIGNLGDRSGALKRAFVPLDIQKIGFIDQNSESIINLPSSSRSDFTPKYFSTPESSPSREGLSLKHAYEHTASTVIANNCNNVHATQL